MNGLKKCPICKGAAEYASPLCAPELVYVQCVERGLKTRNYWTEEQAEEAWNVRPAERRR